MRSYAVGLLGSLLLGSLASGQAQTTEQHEHNTSIQTYVDAAGHDALDLSLLDVDEDTDLYLTSYTPNGQQVKVHVDIDFEDAPQGWGSRPDKGQNAGAGAGAGGAGSGAGSSGSSSGSYPPGTSSGYPSSGPGNNGGVYNPIGSGQTPTVLNPAPYPYCDPHSHDGLVAGHNVTMWYNDTDPTKTEPGYGMVEIPYAKYPTIVLDNTALVTSIVCNQSTCTFTFATVDALKTAAENWEDLDDNNPGDGIVLISANAFISGNSIISDRAYLLIKDIKSVNEGLRQLVCDYTMLGFDEILSPAQNVTVSIGHGSGPGDSFNNGTGSDLPGTGGSVGGGNTPGGNNPPMNGNNTAPLTGPCANATDFDTCLDDRIGYMNPKNLNYDQLLPGIPADEIDTGDDDSSLDFEERRNRRRSLRRRYNPFKSIGNGIKTLYNGAKNLGGKVYDYAKNGVKAFGDFLGNLDPTKEHNFKPFQKDIPIALELPGSEDHVWVGKTLTSKLLYEKENEAKTAKIGVYCVDCGIKGELKFDSVLTFVPLDLIAGKGLRAGQLTANGNIRAAVGLGIEASYSDKWEPEPKLISRVTFNPYQIPGVVEIGPAVSLSAGTTLSIDASGQLYASVALNWPDIQNTLDLVNPGQTKASGWTPQIQKDFGAQGKVEIEATLYTVVSIEVGVFLLGKYKIAAGLSDKPAAVFTASAKGTTAAGGLEDNPTCSASVQIGAKLRNELYFSFDAPFLKEKTYPLLDPPYETGEIGPGEICLAQNNSPKPTPDPSEGGEGSGNNGGNSGGEAGGETPAPGGNDGGNSGGETPAPGGSEDGGNSGGNNGGDNSDGGNGSSGGDGSSGDGGSAGSGGEEGAGGDNSGASGEEQRKKFRLLRRQTTSASNSGTTSPSGSSSSSASTSSSSSSSSAASMQTSGSSSVSTTSSSGSTTSSSVSSSTTGTPTAVSSGASSTTYDSITFSSGLPDIAAANYSSIEPGFGTGNATDDAPDYALITTADGALSMVWSDSGSVYVTRSGVADGSATWYVDQIEGEEEDLIVGDSRDRYFHTYVDDMEKYGVARLRLHNEDKLPKTAVFVDLVEAEYDDPESSGDDYFLIAATSADEYYWPMLCGYADKTAKMFLAKDPDAAAITLVKPEMQAVLTGGPVEFCQFIPLQTL